MNFKDKYTTEAEKEKEENRYKVVISDDTYSILEMMQELINVLKK